MTHSRLKHYNQVAELLRDKITSGKYAPSKKIPTERFLSQELGVSRVTIRRALRTLEQDRLIERRQGSGTYVSPRAERRIPLMIDYTGSMRKHAPDISRELVSWKITKADEYRAGKMRLERGTQLLYAVRIDRLKKKPVAYDHAYIPMQFADNLTDHELSRIDFIETWTKTADFKLKYCSQEIEAIIADSDSMKFLDIGKNMPILKSTEIYFSEKEIPAGLFISYYNPEHICISSRYHWNKD